jgi:hypothetical protein
VLTLTADVLPLTADLLTLTNSSGKTLPAHHQLGKNPPRALALLQLAHLAVAGAVRLEAVRAVAHLLPREALCRRKKKRSASSRAVSLGKAEENRFHSGRR